MARPPRRARRATVVLGCVLVALSLSYPGPTAQAVFPPLPEGEFIAFVTNLTLPVVAPGGSAILTGFLANPTAAPISSVNLTLQFYAFNGYPGNDTGAIPSAGAPAFVLSRGSSEVDWFDLPVLEPSASVPLSAPVSVPASALPGAYAIRTGLEFAENNTTFLLESRGYFNYSTWTSATTGQGGGPTINLTRLGVSGVLPETALSVQANSTLPYVLDGLLGGAVVLAAVGGYYAARRGPKSRSGAR
ncbi:MAG TPA: hypothetical protein VFG07_05960 [Thermoplasmata archaeon]|nr:hypothetical protein [Thermoplasmata archaeon]